jgi:hypothetical protein
MTLVIYRSLSIAYLTISEWGGDIMANQKGKDFGHAAHISKYCPGVCMERMTQTNQVKVRTAYFPNTASPQKVTFYDSFRYIWHLVLTWSCINSKSFMVNSTILNLSAENPSSRRITLLNRENIRKEQAATYSKAHSSICLEQLRKTSHDGRRRFTGRGSKRGPPDDFSHKVLFVSAVNGLRGTMVCRAQNSQSPTNRAVAIFFRAVIRGTI